MGVAALAKVFHETCRCNSKAIDNIITNERTNERTRDWSIVIVQHQHLNYYYHRKIYRLGADAAGWGWVCCWWAFPGWSPSHVYFSFPETFSFLADANGALRHALFNTIYLKSLQNVCIEYSEPVKTTWLLQLVYYYSILKISQRPNASWHSVAFLYLLAYSVLNVFKQPPTALNISKQNKRKRNQSPLCLW